MDAGSVGDPRAVEHSVVRNMQDIRCDIGITKLPLMTHKRSEGVAPKILPSDKSIEFRRNSRDSKIDTLIHAYRSCNSDWIPTCSFAVEGLSTLRSLARATLDHTVERVTGQYVIMKAVRI